MNLAQVGPAGAGARAQLLLALLLMAVAPFFILGRPIQTHAIKLDLRPTPEGPAAPAVAAAPTEAAPASFHRLSSLWVPPDLEQASHLRRVEITPDGRILADGVAVDLVGLRMRFDFLATTTEESWIELRPDPHARYELFVEILALAKRSRFERLRLDNSRYASAIDWD